jgi:glycosyltransferase involved in cell wall biosynthesis
MRLLIVGSYFPKPGNPLMGIWALSQARALQTSGFEVEVVAPTAWVPRAASRWRGVHPALERAAAWATCPERHRWDGVTVHYPRWPLYHVGPHRAWAARHPGREVSAAWPFLRSRLLAIARAHRPDIVLAHGSESNGALALRLRRGLDVPYVVVEHDFDEIRSCAHAPARRRVYQEVAGGAHSVVTVNRRMQADLEAIVPGVQARTIRNGADPLPAAARDRPRPAGLRDRTVVFSAGGFYRRKGFPLLVRAFARVARAAPDALLRIAGDGVDRPAVERAIEEEGIGDRVQLLGYLPHREVQQEMAWADVFALIGWDEPFATVLVEAMAAGTPVVCADDGGIPEVIADGVHGRVVPPRDVDAAAAALLELVREPQDRGRMGDEARRFATSRLTWEANADAVGRLLREAAERR